MYHNDPMGAALDRYITGNYGEDQFRNLGPESEAEYAAFAQIGEENLCPCGGHLTLDIHECRFKCDDCKKQYDEETGELIEEEE